MQWRQSIFGKISQGVSAPGIERTGLPEGLFHRSPCACTEALAQV